MLIGNTKTQTLNFTSAHRFWNGEYVRLGGYRREISFWIKNHYTQNEIEIDNNTRKEISFYFKNGGNFFIELAEDLIKNENDIVYLESLRYLARQSEDFHAFVSGEISSLLDNK